VATPSGEDRFLGGRVKLLQAAHGHRVGTEAVLLAAAAPVVTGLIVDAGAGVGAVGIAAALRMPQARLELLDIDDEACARAAENLALNGLEDRGRAKSVDLLSAKSRRAADVLDSRADLVLVNPPFYEAERVRASPDRRKARAHVLGAEAGSCLEDWVRMATALACADGRVLLVHRADRFDALVAACVPRLGGVSILPIHPREGEPATRILIGGRKGGRAPPRILCGLTLHDRSGGFTPLAEAIHRGEATIPGF
jgi:tRNA1(Val) A37 N6-methylase TrmN6